MINMRTNKSSSDLITKAVRKLSWYLRLVESDKQLSKKPKRAHKTNKKQKIPKKYSKNIQKRLFYLLYPHHRNNNIENGKIWIQIVVQLFAFCVDLFLYIGDDICTYLYVVYKPSYSFPIYLMSCCNLVCIA